MGRGKAKINTSCGQSCGLILSTSLKVCKRITLLARLHNYNSPPQNQLYITLNISSLRCDLGKAKIMFKLIKIRVNIPKRVIHSRFRYKQNIFLESTKLLSLEKFIGKA